MTISVTHAVEDLDALADRLSPLADEVTWCVHRRDAAAIADLLTPMSVIELRALVVVLAAARTPQWTLPSDGIVDEVAVERAVAGEQLPLTRDERAAAAARLVAAGAGVTELAGRLHLSGTTARALYDRCRN